MSLHKLLGFPEKWSEEVQYVHKNIGDAHQIVAIVPMVEHEGVLYFASVSSPAKGVKPDQNKTDWDLFLPSPKSKIKEEK